VQVHTIAVDRELAGVDAVTVGARAGRLWRAPGLTLAGIGEALRLDGLDAGSVLGTLGPEVTAIGALPFDRTTWARAGDLVVPEVLFRQDHTGRSLTLAGAAAAAPTAAIDRVRALAGPPPATGRRRAAVVHSPIPAEVWRDTIVPGAIARIRAGELRKVVLARQVVTGGITTARLTEIVRRLATRFPTAYLFAADGFVGASPELLVARAGDEVHAHPLAGTVPRGTTPEDDAQRGAALLASTKNQWEHLITIDWLLDNLLPFCSYVDAEPEPTLVSLANVHHLGTRVAGRLSAPAASVLDLVRALHPTPAVGGDPQDRALAVIAELEGFDRGRYAGPVGWVDGVGNGQFAVAIRSAQLVPERDELHLYAGVGVVAESDPAAELAETEAKLAAVASVLGPVAADDATTGDTPPDPAAGDAQPARSI
jgi:menaquinone-specific isochorismate synthase